MSLSQQHFRELSEAVQILENPGIAAKITHLIGSPIEKGLELLPENWNEKIGEITRGALTKALDTAVYTLKDAPASRSSNWWHTIGVASTGAVGGFFGIGALALELPVSTTIMLRSIADIARSEGESLQDPDAKLACLEVFALGGKSKSDDAVESSYFAVRTALARSITEAAQLITAKTITEETAPQLLKFVVKIASRFSIQVTEKMAAQAVPAIGAAGGAIVNTLFIDHFQSMAKGHFVVRRLEKIYGADTVQSAYEDIVRKNR